MRPTVAAAVAALAFPLLVSSPATAGGFAPGSTQGGDPYFPQAGNGGYDVQHYHLNLAYTPDTGRLEGRATITLRATDDLSSLSLDLRNLRVRSVQVDGERAAFTQEPPDEATGAGGELIVRPQAGLEEGSVHRVRVVYGGIPGQPVDLGGAPYGWYSFPDGSFVANEPEGASTWYPVNDTPTDKATYRFLLTVPDGKTAIANGDLVRTRPASDGRTTFVWRATDPMASYLSTASIGDYVMTRQTGPGGLPILNFLEEDLTPENRAVSRASLALQPEMIDFFDDIYGPYPFTSYGAIVDDDSVGYALETQTRPIYSEVATESTVAHELAHQWVGNSVTPETWPDLWLNEGFATYSEWLWGEHRGGPTAQQRYDDVYAIPADDDFWTVPPGDPGAADLFNGAVYDRGAAALHALRERIGDDGFFRLLRLWATQNADGNVSTADLVRLAERISGQELDGFFEDWIHTPERPAGY